MDQLSSQYPQLQRFFEVVKKNIKKKREWQEEVVIFGQIGRKVLRIRGTALDQLNQEKREQVVVVDDLTELIQAQKDSAWSEMARRIAHEIENPINPIQL